MRYTEILLEYDESKTLASFGPRILDQIVKTSKDRGARIPPFMIDGIKVKDPDSMNKGLSYAMLYIKAADPTSNHKFVIPLINWFLSGIRLEDLYKARQPLEIYIKFRNRIKGLDLNKISFDQFIDLMEKEELTPSNSEQDKAEEENMFARGEAKLVVDNSQMKIVQPLTMAASCHFGRNTRWCTAARDKDDNQFAAYASTGPLFIILDKANNRRWQFYFDTESYVPENQFMDEKDHEVNPRKVMNGEPFKLIRNWSDPDLEAVMDKVGDDEMHDYAYEDRDHGDDY